MSEPATDFDEAMRQAVEQAGVAPDTEFYADYITKAESNAENAEPPAEEPEPEAEQASEPPVLLAGKYKTVEDLERGYREAQAELNRRGNEVDQLRQISQEFDVLRNHVNRPDPGTLTAQLDEAPWQVVQAAAQRGDQALFDQGMRAWYDIDPYGATQYQAQINAAQIRAQLAPDMDRSVQVANQQELSVALNNVQARHDDFNDVIGTLTPERLETLVQDGFPAGILEGLTGDLTAKERVIETLYRWQKADQSDTITEIAAQQAEQQADQTRAEKRQATVASATTTSPPEIPEEEAERMSRVFKDMDLSWRASHTGIETRR